MYILYIDNWDFLNVKLHQSAVINIINGMFLDSWYNYYYTDKVDDIYMSFLFPSSIITCIKVIIMLLDKNQ